jgi:hypothetical protein
MGVVRFGRTRAIVNMGWQDGLAAGARVVGAIVLLVALLVVALAAGSIELASGAVFSNSGTFNLNDNEKACEEGCGRTGLEKGSGSSSFVNTGVVKKAEGTREVGLGVNTENLGTINGKSGPIAFVGGSNSSVLGNSSVLEGAVEIESASVTGDSFKVTGGELTLVSGTLSMAEGDTATEIPCIRRGWVACEGKGRGGKNIFEPM